MEITPETNKRHIALSAIILSLIGSVTLVVVKGFSGYLGNSYALIADAIESTADIFSSALVYLGIRFAHKPPDKNHPYGHGKVEPLMTFVIVAFLLGSAAIIAYNSIYNIQHRHSAPESWTLLVLIPIIVWKEFAFHVINRRAKRLNSNTLKAEAWHQRSDAMTSVAAFIGIAVAVVMGEGYEKADDWAALFAAGIIVYNTYHLFRPALAELMDEHQHDALVERIRHESTKVAGILGTEKCFVRKAGTFYWVDLHAIVDGTLSVTEGHDLAHQLKDHLQEQLPDIQDVLIHVEPYHDGDCEDKKHSHFDRSAR